MSTTEPTTSRHTRGVQRFHVTLTIIGAVGSAVVTALLAAEGATLTSKLVGTAVAAAIPPLVGAVGPGHEVRVTVAVLLTAVAVVLGYGGDQLLSGVTDKNPSLPTPVEIVTKLAPEPGPAPDDEPAADALVERAGALGIKVEPGSLTCEAEGGCNPVTLTVTSVGTEPLAVYDLEFEGDAGSYLTASGCTGAVLTKGQKCEITLQFFPDVAPSSARTHLVIHQNFPEVPTLVPLEAHGVLAVEPNLGLGPATCELPALVTDPDTGDVSGQLVVGAPLSVTALAEGIPVQATVYVDGVEWRTVGVDPDQASVAVSDIYEGPAPGEVFLQIDPGHLVAESDEDDNVAPC